MASKVLELLWNLAHRDDSPLDTMEHSLNAHIKILDYSCSQVIISYNVPLSLSVSLLSLHIYILSSPFIYILSSPFIYSPLPSYIYTLLSLPQPLSLSSSFPLLSRTRLSLSLSLLSLSQICIKRWSVMVRIEPSTYGNYFNKMIITFYSILPLLSLSLFFFLLSLSSFSLPPNKDTASSGLPR